MSIETVTNKYFLDRGYFLATPNQFVFDAGGQDAGLQIFLHIPKCGGTMLHTILHLCSALEKSRYYRFCVNDFNPAILITPGWTGAWNTVRTKVSSTPSDLRYISGHFPFGVHRFFGEPYRYITLIRDPLRREVSSYNYLSQDVFFNNKIPLEVFIERKWILDNPQVRMIAGIDAMEGPCTEQTYQTAIGNLEEDFMLVGIVEEADVFLSAVLGVNRWPPVMCPHINVTETTTLKTIGDGLAGMIADYHSLDIRLHEYASERWGALKKHRLVCEPQLQDDEEVFFIAPSENENYRGALVKARDVERLVASIS